MPKFRRKSALVEANPWFKEGDHKAVVRAVKRPDGTVTSIDTTSSNRGEGYPSTFVTFTPEGVFEVSPGDWIITEENGVSYPLNPDKFLTFYEGV